MCIYAKHAKDDNKAIYKWAVTCDFQQCGILTSVA